VGDTEVWEFYNFTADAHPMHVHEVVFEVVSREVLVLDSETGEPVQPVQLSGDRRPAELWETGFKHTVIAIRVRSRASRPNSTHPDSSSGTAISSSTRTTR
jgi:FtsP/CotA-like multicopper oxidase with cupredoxin domain